MVDLHSGRESLVLKSLSKCDGGGWHCRMLKRQQLTLAFVWDVKILVATVYFKSPIHTQPLDIRLSKALFSLEF